MKHAILILALLAVAPALCFAADKPLTVKAINKFQIARASQTIELTAKQLEPLGAKELNTIHVKDAAGKEVLCQAVDVDGDAYHTSDIVIFQADFAPGEAKTFSLSVGKKQEFSKDQYKAFGRFVRERFDDFAWENDRIAHRMYGKALETWAGEPLSSSTVDVWSKRVSRMVIDEWYMCDNYHADTGEGYDDFSAGRSRGCGANGLWANNWLWTSRNFVNSRVLTNGPIRVTFELTYDPFDVNGISVAETKRISLDAGQNLDHFKSFYKQYSNPGRSVALVTGIGLRKVKSEQKELNAAHGWLVKWEEMEKRGGQQGMAIVFDPKLFVQQAEDKLNQLVLENVPDDGVADYWAGFCWDKAGQFANLESWKKYVDAFAQGLASPVEVSVSAE